MASLFNRFSAFLDESWDFSDSSDSSTSSEKDHSVSQSHDSLGMKITDLPEEMLTMIFLELDSLTRKRIESVCKKWLTVLRGDKVLRTNVKLEFSGWTPCVDKIVEYELKLPRLFPAKVEFLHIRIGDDPERYGLYGLLVQYLPEYLSVNIINTDLLLTNFRACIPFGTWPKCPFKRIVFRDSFITPQLHWIGLGGPEVFSVTRPNKSPYGEWKMFKELTLNLAEDPYQLAKIYMNDSGPLSERDHIRLLGVAKIVQGDLDTIGDSFERVGLKLDMRAMLADVAAGRNIPRFVAHMLIRIAYRDYWHVGDQW